MSRTTRSSIEMLEQTVNATKGFMGDPSRIMVGRDVAGYVVYRLEKHEGKVEKTLKYGLSAKETYLYLEGMVTALYSLQEK